MSDPPAIATSSSTIKFPCLLISYDHIQQVDSANAAEMPGILNFPVIRLASIQICLLESLTQPLYYHFVKVYSSISDVCTYNSTSYY